MPQKFKVSFGNSNQVKKKKTSIIKKKIKNLKNISQGGKILYGHR